MNEGHDTALSMLMHDLFCPDPDKMYFQSLAKVARYYKEDPEGIRELAATMERHRENGREEARINAAVRMIEDGKLTLEEIAGYAELDIEEAQAIADDIKEGTTWAVRLSD